MLSKPQRLGLSRIGVSAPRLGTTASQMRLPSSSGVWPLSIVTAEVSLLSRSMWRLRSAAPSTEPEARTLGPAWYGAEAWVTVSAEALAVGVAAAVEADAAGRMFAGSSAPASAAIAASGGGDLPQAVRRPAAPARTKSEDRAMCVKGAPPVRRNAAGTTRILADRSRARESSSLGRSGADVRPCARHGERRARPAGRSGSAWPRKRIPEPTSPTLCQLRPPRFVPRGGVDIMFLMRIKSGDK